MDNDIRIMLGRVEGKLDSLIDTVSIHVQDDKQFQNDMEQRVGGLERWRAYIVGLGAAAGMAGTKLISLIGGGH